MLGNIEDVKKALVTVTIEKTLIDIGKPIYDMVIEKLNSKNHYLPDCYEHPEYLSEALAEIYGKSAYVIVESITKQLEEYDYHRPIKKFLEIICI